MFSVIHGYVWVNSVLPISWYQTVAKKKVITFTMNNSPQHALVVGLMKNIKKGLQAQNLLAYKLVIA